MGLPNREPDIVVPPRRERTGIDHATGELSVDDCSTSVAYRGIQKQGQPTAACVGRAGMGDLLKEIDVSTVPPAGLLKRRAADHRDCVGCRRSVVPAAKLVASLELAKLG